MPGICIVTGSVAATHLAALGMAGNLPVPALQSVDMVLGVLAQKRSGEMASERREAAEPWRGEEQRWWVFLVCSCAPNVG